jgi:hypothetical protein
MKVPVTISLGVEQGGESEEDCDWRIRELDEDDDEYWEIEHEETDEQAGRRQRHEEEEEEDGEDEDHDDEEGDDTYEELSEREWEGVNEQPRARAQRSSNNDKAWVLAGGQSDM